MHYDLQWCREANACSHTVTRDDSTTSSDRRAHAYYSKLQEPLQMFVLRWEQTEYGSVLPQGMTYNPWD